ncbi:hypothetical protein GCM10010307_10570 [Streptomyces vastus]|uniref:Uncharacterized protein n=1 Tax=Streptomyces vastus TaxID=285451 RepID=A0ABN3QEJ9_9ACTN
MKLLVTGSGVRGVRDARAGRGRMTAVKIVGHREVGDGTESGLAEMTGDAVVAGGGDLRGPPGARGGDPDQSAAGVGDAEEQQAVGLVFPAVVAPVVRAGAALGAHKGAVEQDGMTALSDDAEAAPSTAVDHTAYEQEPGVEDGVGAGVVGVVEEGEVDKTGAVIQRAEDDPLAGADRRGLGGGLGTRDQTASPCRASRSRRAVTTPSSSRNSR